MATLPELPELPDLPELARLRSLAGVKWTRYSPDVLPAWVADMDLPPFPGAVDAVRDLVERGDFGYSFAATAALPEAYATWQRESHGWAPDPAEVRVFCDVLQAVDAALMLRTAPGDGVVLLTPVYPPFFRVVESVGRRVIDCPLEPGTWTLDRERLESVIDDRTTAILLCDPHNPTGRAFTRDELDAIAGVAERHDLLVISDEIWSDLVFAPGEHVPFASLGEDAAGRTVTVSSASKAFNLAGLRCAVAHVGDARLRDGLAALPDHLLGAVGTPGAVAALAAWTGGREWLEGTRAFLGGQREHAAERLADRLPAIGVTIPEATYLLWLDMRALGLGDDPAAWLLEHARVALSPGPDFGPHGRGYARLNLATSRYVLDAILDRIEGVLR